MKLELKLTNDWLEATWYEDDKQVHCESFSGHPEHIEMLRSKLTEYGTETTAEDETMIAEAIGNFVMPTEAELEAYAKEQALIQAKADREIALSTMVVTTQSGKVFDADVQARLNISNAITVSDAVGVTETVWRLADNSEVLVTVAELREALMLALTEYARLKGIGQ